MEFESAQSNTTAKLPILKLGEYEMWVIRIKQYFQVQDYALWEVIENEKTNRKNDVITRSLLLTALPNEHQLTCSQYTDAKTMFAAIKIRFGGNEAAKKTQKTLLKQQYENFSATSTGSLDSIFNRLQKIKKSVGVSSGAQNLAFMTAPSTSSTNDVNTAKPAYEVSTISSNVNTASPQVSTASFSDNVVYAFMVENLNGSNLLHHDLEKIHEDDLEAIDLKWQLSLLSMRAKRYYQRTGKKIFIIANDTTGDNYYGKQYPNEYYHEEQLNAQFNGKITVVILVRDRCPCGKGNLPRLPIRTNIVRLATPNMGLQIEAVTPNRSIHNIRVHLQCK
ncbi:hypothetical protein Tco_0057881 [Tanacetum coccineum]